MALFLFSFFWNGAADSDYAEWYPFLERTASGRCDEQKTAAEDSHELDGAGVRTINMSSPPSLTKKHAFVYSFYLCR